MQALEKKSKTGHFVTTPIGQLDGGFSGPHGVAFDSKHKSIVVADCCCHQLQFFSRQDSCKYLSAFRSNGTENNHFGFPTGVCFQPATNNLIVTDSHRVQVFSISSSSSSSLIHLFSVGKAEDFAYFYLSDAENPAKGSGPSQFNDPSGICCTARGDIIVADSGNDRMQIIDCKGRHVRAFGSQGRGSDQFQNPSDVCVQEDAGANRMIITDSSNQRLSVWSVDGCEPILTVPVQREIDHPARSLGSQCRPEYRSPFSNHMSAYAQWNVRPYEPDLIVTSAPQGICSYPRTHRIAVSCGVSCGRGYIDVLDCKTKNKWNVIQKVEPADDEHGYGGFDAPRGVCVDDRGVLFVADSGNDRVQMF